MIKESEYLNWIITTVAGTGDEGYSGDGGLAVEAKLNNPFDVVFDSNENLIFSDTFNHCIRRVNLASGILDTIAGTGNPGYSGDGSSGREASFNEPYGLAIDTTNAIYIADRLNSVVRRIDGDSDIVTTFAGNGMKEFGGDGGLASRAGMLEPNGLAFSQDKKQLFIADVADNRVRVVDITSGKISTFAGTGRAAHDGDGGPATKASIFGARAVFCKTLDDSVYILERQGSCLRLVDSKNFAITTVASTGETGYGGDGGPVSNAIFDRPKELTIDHAGNILIVDTENNVIRLINIEKNIVETVAGNATWGFSGDELPAISSSLARPHGVVVGPDGSLYIGDTENNRIRRVSPPSMP